MGEVICAFGYHRLEETPFIWCEGIGGKVKPGTEENHKKRCSFTHFEIQECKDCGLYVKGKKLQKK